MSEAENFAGFNYHSTNATLVSPTFTTTTDPRLHADWVREQKRRRAKNAVVKAARASVRAGRVTKTLRAALEALDSL